MCSTEKPSKTTKNEFWKKIHMELYTFAKKQTIMLNNIVDIISINYNIDLKLNTENITNFLNDIDNSHIKHLILFLVVYHKYKDKMIEDTVQFYELQNI